VTPRRRAPPAATAGAPDVLELGIELTAPQIGEVAAVSVQIPVAMPGESAATPIAVSDLAQTLKEIVEGSFPALWVIGEVSDFKMHRNGHWYFTLRDAGAQIRCVVWSRDTRRIIAAPDEGMLVVARGQLSVYAARSEVQFQVTALQSVGDGLWRKAFDQTRAKLEADGLLDPARRRRLPPFPRRIGVITSPDGAALHDIIAVVRRRCPCVEVVAIPAAVQGEGAPDSLCAALALAARWRGADVIIIGRGGGSREDLWAFNDERLARAVAASPVPIVSAVGHEVDITICDLVADLRAPTPSAAAEAVVPVLDELVAQARALGTALRDAACTKVEEARATLQATARQATLASRRIVERGGLQLSAVSGRLNALSPLATMGRGYTLVFNADGSLRTSVAGLTTGSAVKIQFLDGTAETTVSRVDEGAPRGRTRP
jgi:exodeoxyribonuclease VII large subunit